MPGPHRAAFPYGRDCPLASLRQTRPRQQPLALPRHFPAPIPAYPNPRSFLAEPGECNWVPLGNLAMLTRCGTGSKTDQSLRAVPGSMSRPVP